MVIAEADEYPCNQISRAIGILRFFVVDEMFRMFFVFPQEDVHMDIRGSYWKHVQRQECRKTKRY